MRFSFILLGLVFACGALENVRADNHFRAEDCGAEVSSHLEQILNASESDGEKKPESGLLFFLRLGAVSFESIANQRVNEIRSRDEKIVSQGQLQGIFCESLSYLIQKFESASGEMEQLSRKTSELPRQAIRMIFSEDRREIE